MNIGEIIEIEILSVGMSGEGVGRLDGKVVFVPYTLEGERVRVVVKQIKSKFVNASAIKIIDPSPERVTPGCKYFFKCGGCDMMHISPEYRRAALVNELKNNMKKIANIECDNVGFAAGTSAIGCRNKLSMPFALSDGKVVSGLYRQNSHTVERVECAMSGELAKTIAKTVCDFANAKRISVYDEKTGNGVLRHLVVREIGGRASATLVINAERVDGEKALAELLPNNVDFFVCPNRKKNNVVMGERVRLIKGNERLKANVMGVKAELSPLSFFQVNDDVRDKLYSAVMAELSSDRLLDLYSGIGITSNLAANKGMSVTAVECVEQAVADADHTAKINGNAEKIDNICGDVEKVLTELRTDMSGADVLVDPPRKGCGASVMTALAAIAPKKLIYVSCNHATMCRDISIFLDETPNYEITACKIFDMFPNTHHTEVMCVLAKKSE